MALTTSSSSAEAQPWSWARLAEPRPGNAALGRARLMRGHPRVTRWDLAKSCHFNYALWHHRLQRGSSRYLIEAGCNPPPLAHSPTRAPRPPGTGLVARRALGLLPLVPPHTEGSPLLCPCAVLLSQPCTWSPAATSPRKRLSTPNPRLLNSRSLPPSPRWGSVAEPRSPLTRAAAPACVTAPGQARGGSALHQPPQGTQPR